MKPNLSKSSACLGLLAFLANPAIAGAQERFIFPTEEDPTEVTTGASSRSASEGAEFLLIPVGARAVGMGGAVTGLRQIGELVLWNPAGIAGMEDGRLLFNHAEGAFETRSEVLSLLWPTKSLGTFAITYYLVDFGDLPSTDINGTVQGNINFRNQEFLLSYARALFGPLEFGLNYKLIQLVFRCDGTCADQQSFTRTTHAVDLGLIVDGVAGLPLSMGGSVRHLGFALEGANSDDPLPTRVRVGLAYEALSMIGGDSNLGLAIAVDLEDQWRNPGDPDLMVGSEFGVAERFFVRAGYAFLDAGRGGPSLGLGLTYDWFYVDLSRGFDELSSATGEEAVQVSFGVIF